MLSNDLIEAMHFDFGGLTPPFNTADDDPIVFTYAFRAEQPATLPVIGGYDGWVPFTAAEEAATRAALDEIESFANIRFVETPGAADPRLDFGKADVRVGIGEGGAAWAWRDGRMTAYEAFAVFDADLDLTGEPDLIRHEIGHALGLAHPFEGVTLPDVYENKGYTLMSYTDDPFGDGSDEGAYQILDVMALQFLWGESDGAGSRGDRLALDAGDGHVPVVLDTGGRDVIAAGDTHLDARIDLREGAFSYLGEQRVAAVAFDAAIEVALGGRGDDWLGGSAGDNVLAGRGGADTLLGRGGKDVLRGGGGDDTLRSGSGADTLRGGAGADDLRAGHGADELRGGAGGDALRGGRGADDLRGGRGADDLHGGAGRDALHGNRGADQLHGGAGRDRLLGGAGNDELDGGRGRDVMTGGAGADTFHFARGDGRDVITDLGRGEDVLRLEGFGSRQDVMDAAQERGHGVVLDLNGGHLTLRGADMDDLWDALLLG